MDDSQVRCFGTFSMAQLNIPSQTNQKGARKRRRYRRSKSAPASEILSTHNNTTSNIDQRSSESTALKKLHTSSIKVITILVIYLSVGTVCFYLTRHQIRGKKTNGVVDALYLSVVTMSTVGYGDIVPNSAATKLLACAFVFSGMALVALGLSKAADTLVEKQETLLVRALQGYKDAGMGEILKEMETNRVRIKCLMTFLLLLVLIIAGTVFLAEVEELSFIDSFYCVCCTITTLGFGDVSFTTDAGRIFAAFWILAGTICLAQFFLYLAELNTERRQKKLVKWVLDRRMTTADLEVADFDEDGSVE